MVPRGCHRFTVIFQPYLRMSVDMSASLSFTPNFSHAPYNGYPTRTSEFVHPSVREQSINLSIHVDSVSISDSMYRRLRAIGPALFARHPPLVRSATPELSALSPPTPSIPRTTTSLRSAAVVQSSKSSIELNSEQMLDSQRQQQYDVAQPLSEAGRQHIRAVAFMLTLYAVYYWPSSSVLFSEMSTDNKFWEMMVEQHYRRRHTANGVIDYSIGLEQLMTGFTVYDLASTLRRVVGQTPSEWRGRVLWSTELAEQLLDGQRRMEDWHVVRVLDEGWFFKGGQVEQVVSGSSSVRIKVDRVVQVLRMLESNHAVMAEMGTSELSIQHPVSIEVIHYQQHSRCAESG